MVVFFACDGAIEIFVVLFLLYYRSSSVIFSLSSCCVASSSFFSRRALATASSRCFLWSLSRSTCLFSLANFDWRFSNSQDFRLFSADTASNSFWICSRKQQYRNQLRHNDPTETIQYTRTDFDLDQLAILYKANHNPSYNTLIAIRNS